ncbi:MAG: signal peptidase I [Firmicutes bacterium]|nr:signal peptidase I [Bacillota bacterium]
MDLRDIKEFLIDSFKVIILIVVVLFLMVFVFSVTQVVGNSMNPTLKDGEVLLLNKFIYRFSDVKRGDIISLDYDDTKYLIKRVIGLPGDTINIKNNKVYINNQVYEEDYLPDYEYEDFYLSSLGYNTIPEDMYFVIGDNREDSLDSRKIGLINKDDINGKISFRFWPLNKLKFY